MGKKAPKPATARQKTSAAPFLSSASPGLQRAVFVLVGLYVLFKLLLPALADMTPPGVDREEVIKWSNIKPEKPSPAATTKQQQQQASGAPGAKHKCENPCLGQSCPDGWETARSTSDECKCICKRVAAAASSPLGEAGEERPHVPASQPSDAELAAKKKACANACLGLSCPDGWETGRSPTDVCKCICVRQAPKNQMRTNWDDEHEREQKRKLEQSGWGVPRAGGAAASGSGGATASASGGGGGRTAAAEAHAATDDIEL